MFVFPSDSRYDWEKSGVLVVRRELSELGVYMMGRREREGTRRGRARQYIWDQRTSTVVYFLTIMTSRSASNLKLSEP
jgi:hypothetical protein